MAAKPTDEPVSRTGDPRKNGISNGIVVGVVDLRREWENLRAAKSFCDVELRGAEAQSTGIPCHRSVLSVNSTYFRNMFLSGMKESTQKVIHLQNISHTVLSQLIDYCYMTEISLTESNVQSLLTAASFLDIGTFVGACWEFMERRMDIKNCLMLYCFADSDAHKNPALADKAKAVVFKHFVGISEGTEFLELPKNVVIDLIRCDALYVRWEDEVFDAVIRWLHHDFEHRRCQAWEMLQYIRASYLRPPCHDEYMQASIKAFVDYSGTENAVCLSENLNVLPGYISEVSSSRYIARTSYGLESMIICAGGHRDNSVNSMMDSVECFNPRTSRWRKLTPLPYSIADGGLAVVHDDLFVCGGITGIRNVDVASRMFRHSSARTGWTEVAPMQTSRACAGIVADGDHIYAIGGHGADHTSSTVERYSVLTNQWTFVASLPVPLEKFAVVSIDGQIFAFGGVTSKVITANATDLAFCYDPKADIWSELPKMPTARYRASACVGSDGWIYVIGGRNPGAIFNCVEAFNPRTNQWTKKCGMSQPINSAGVCCLGNKIYVLGGYNAGSESSIGVYDVFSDTWTTSDSHLPHEKWAFGCGVVEVTEEASQRFFM
ncbi:kelch-like protein 12 [Paramacrobiotus metropolitanus]|uniref:kelch-like protein 12 n=1 Tax=Paramacrobiotus metropolitanus TaxID=2943436 RepID=UPI00244622DC|nr:kelch-like protein 12 [Paramacrobiotus metropolitanus]